MSDPYIDEQLSKAQKLLWGGSETENIEAHNIISHLRYMTKGTMQA